ncbi:MAG: hypothetical protein M1823_001005 [Watsoniomyces obsoletus]|nr:MAG: hypothetical protein M1823_001005 [Watsoniomyces obsoletus]
MEISSLLNPISTPSWSGGLGRVFGERSAAEDSSATEDSVLVNSPPRAIEEQDDDSEVYSPRASRHSAIDDQSEDDAIHQGKRRQVTGGQTGYKSHSTLSNSLPPPPSSSPTLSNHSSSPTFPRTFSSFGAVSPDSHLRPRPASHRTSTTPRPWFLSSVTSSDSPDAVIQHRQYRSPPYQDSPRSSVSSISLPIGSGSPTRSCFSSLNEMTEVNDPDDMISPANTLIALASVAIDDDEKGRRSSQGQTTFDGKKLVADVLEASTMGLDRLHNWTFNPHFSGTSIPLPALPRSYFNHALVDEGTGRQLRSHGMKPALQQPRYRYDSEPEDEYEDGSVNQRRLEGPPESAMSDEDMDSEYEDGGEEDGEPPASSVDNNRLQLNKVPHPTLGLFVHPESGRASVSPLTSMPGMPSNQETIFNPDGAANPLCSYTEHCTTGSPLRKVVSHIFGRNKLCTRQIPKGAWVHYCRKHYQRSRYRNPHGFALLQCDLVRKQIDRLRQWGGVRDWIVKIRKREEERLMRENAELAAAGPNGLNGPNATPAGYNNTNAQGANGGGWGWLVQVTGGGKTTEEVMQILDRIETEIDTSAWNFPDIEILPNVVGVTGGRSGSGSAGGSNPGRRRTVSTESQAGPAQGSVEAQAGPGQARPSTTTTTATTPRKRKVTFADTVEYETSSSSSSTIVGNGAQTGGSQDGQQQSAATSSRVSKRSCLRVRSWVPPPGLFSTIPARPGPPLATFYPGHHLHEVQHHQVQHHQEQHHQGQHHQEEPQHLRLMKKEWIASGGFSLPLPKSMMNPSLAPQPPMYQPSEKEKRAVMSLAGALGNRGDQYEEPKPNIWQ